MRHQNLSAMIAIAEKATEVYRLEQALRNASCDMRDACADFREKHNGGDYVPRGTDMHEAMREATGLEYAAYSDAKRAVYNAKRRLDTAIRANLTGGAR